MAACQPEKRGKGGRKGCGHERVRCEGWRRTRTSVRVGRSRKYGESSGATWRFARDEAHQEDL
eukprot:355927-Chlamydomonas_euryale.AAC.3